MNENYDDLIFEINEAFKLNKNANIRIYPEFDSSESSIFIPKKINLNNFKTISKFTIEETYFRDLIKIYSENINNSNQITAQKYSYIKIKNKLMMIVSYYNTIPNEKFPYSCNSLHTEKKIVKIVSHEKLKLCFFDLVVTNDILSINVKKNPTSNQENILIKNELIEIINIINSINI